MVHRPTCTPVRTRTLSTLFVASRPAGFGVDSPGFEPVYWLPRYTVPSGAVIARSRSFTRHTLHPAVPGKSVHTRVTSTDSEGSPIARAYVTVSPVLMPERWSSIDRPRASPAKNIASSKVTRPNPWSKFGYRVSPKAYAPVPVISRPLLMIIDLRRAAEGVKPFAGCGLPVGYHPSMKYCRTRVAAPAVVGVAMLVPLNWK